MILAHALINLKSTVYHAYILHIHIYININTIDNSRTVSFERSLELLVLLLSMFILIRLTFS